jgi:hypothetical protein
MLMVSFCLEPLNRSDGLSLVFWGDEELRDSTCVAAGLN